MKKRILILSGSRYNIRSIEAAKEEGYEVLVIDRNPEAEGFHYADNFEIIDFVNSEAVVEVAKKHSIDGIIPMNDYGVLTAAIVCNKLGLPGNSINAAKNATSKALMRKVWEEQGVPSPKFSILKNIDKINNIIKNFGTWPLIVKPVDSRGGASRGVSKVNSINELDEAINFAASFYDDKSIIIEEFLDGKEYSIEAVTYKGNTKIIAIADNIKMPEPYRVNKSLIYPALITNNNYKKIEEVVSSAINSIGITMGISHIELCMTKNGPKLIEINARCGGGGIPDPIVPYVTGIEEFKVAVRLAVGDSPGIIEPQKSNACVYRFLTPNVGHIKKIEGIKKIQSWKNILDCDILLKEGQTVKPIKTGIDRAGFIIAGGKNRKEAIALADKAEKEIVFQIE